MQRYQPPIYKIIVYYGGGVVLPNPFRGMRAWRNFKETQQSRHAPRSGLEIYNGRNSAKDGAPRGSDAGQSRRR